MNRSFSTIFRLVFCVVCPAFGLYAVASAAPPAFQFRSLTVEKGLSSNTVRSMCQDSQGLIWFGTGEGLNSFDGISIVRHPLHADGNSHNVNYINALFEDSEGRLWVGTDVGVFFRRSGAGESDFVRLACRTRDSVELSSIITHIAEDHDRNLWFATRGQGLFRYAPDDDALSQFLFECDLNDVEYVYADSNNTVWAAVSFSDVPLYTLNKVTDSFVAPRLKYLGCRPQRVQCLLEDASGFLWFGTWDGGLQRYDRQTRKVTPYLASGEAYGFTHIHSMTEYAPGELLIGSDDGLLWYNTLTRRYLLFANDQYDAVSLTDKFVYPVIKDAEGGLWVGTYYGGVNYAAPNSGQFERYSMSRLVGHSEGYVVSCFCEDEEGNVWIGSDNGGLMCFSPRTHRVLHHYVPERGRNSISTHNIHALCADGPYLWIGTYAGGLNRLDMRSGTFRIYHASNAPSALDNESVYALFRDRAGNLWVTTMSGVLLYDRQGDRFVRIRTFGETTLDIGQTPDGDLWFATSGGGIFRYAAASGKWRCYRSASGGLICDHVNSLYMAPDGEVWAGTAEGLCRYDADQECFSPVVLETGSAGSSNITYVVGDGKSLWLTTTQGLLRYTLSDGQCVRFGISDGLVGEQFMVNSGILTSEGKIYVGSTNGFNAFFSHLIYQNRYMPPVLVTGFVAHSHGRHGESASAGIDFSRDVVLSHRQRDISVSYAALSYCAPEKNTYAYKLEGFDTQWRYVGGQTIASYTNLPAGRYRLRVRAANSDGVWNDAGASVSIVVRPHPLWSVWAKIIYVLLGLLASAFAWRAFLRWSERKTVESFDLFRRTRDAEEFRAKIQFMTMIAHEIRTPVSLIIGPLEKIMSHSDQWPEGLGQDLRIIDRNSHRLLQLINQLLDFKKMNPDGGMALNVSECNVGALLASICDRFRPTMEQKGIDFSCSFPDSGFVAMVDSEALTKVVSNLLSNAVKYTGDRVSLSCSVDYPAQQFTIRVVDNGPGLKPSDCKKIFVPFYRVDESKSGTGIGLTIVKHIVESHNGTVSVGPAEGGGAAFVVMIPLTQPFVDIPGDVAVAEVPAKLPVDYVSDFVSGEPAPAGDEGAITLLIVEDDADMLDFLVSSFQEKYRVLRASSGEEAFDILQERNVTLIISDWMMPGISGADLCRRVRENRFLCHIPFILLTAKSDFSSSLESLDCGADAHVKKPFSLVYLQAMVSHLIDIRTMLVHKFSAMPDLTLQPVSSNQGDEAFLARMKELIDANISNVDFSIDMLAEKMCISRSGLFSKLRSMQGITPNKLIQNARLKSAARILLEGKYPVNVVSYMVGFNNPSYFSKCFFRQYGMGPREWIERHAAQPARPDENTAL